MAKRSRTRPSSNKTADNISDAGRQSHQKGHTFEERVITLLRLMGMDVKPRENYGCRETDFVASEKHRLRELWFVGECKDYDDRVGVEEVAQLFARLTAFQKEHRRSALGLLVVASDQGISDSARAHARSLEAIELLTYRELQDRLVDLAGYNDRLIRDIEAEGRQHSPYLFVESHYIPLRVKPDQDDQPIQLLDDYIRSFLNDPGARSLTILGDYGTGKTWFTKKVALELARAYAAAPDSARQPIRIDLREVAQEITLQSVLNKHFQTAMGRPVDIQALLHLAVEGRYVFILDGFDEMVARIAHQYAVQNFRELLQAGTGESKLILTCRTQYFRSQKDVDGLLSTGKHLQSTSATELYRDLSQSAGNRVGYLAYFERKQSEAYINRVCGAGADLIHELLRKQPRLRELAARPVLLDMLARTAPYLAEESTTIAPLTVAMLYETYTRSWFDHQRKKGMVGNVEPFWRQLLEDLAAELWQQPGNEMPYQELGSLVQRVASAFVRGPNEGALAEQETRTALFLTRNADGVYRFSHRSFLEFFLACRLQKSIKDPSYLPRQLVIEPLSSPAMEFLCELAGKREVAAAAAWILEKPYSPKASENALLLWAQAGAPIEFRPKRMMLAGAALNGYALADIDLSNADLQGASLRRSDLSNADLRNANLESCDLTGAILRRAKVGGVVLRNSCLDFADMWAAEGQADFGTVSSMVGVTLAEPTEAAAFALSPRVIVPSFSLSFSLVTLSADNRLAAVAARCQILLYDLPTGQLRATLAGHDETIRSIAFAPNGRALASGSDDCTVKLWDLETGRLRYSLECHADAVWSLHFAPNGETLASGSDDCTVKLWEVESGQLRHTCQGHRNAVRCVAFAPDGRILVSGSDDRTVKLWDAESGRLRHTLEGHANAVRCVAFAPNGRMLASGSRDLTIKLWEAERGQLRDTLAGHSKPVRAVAFTADGLTLASVSDDLTVDLRDTESKLLRRRVTYARFPSSSVAFTQDGSILASCRWNSVLLLDVKTGQERKLSVIRPDTVRSLSFSPDIRTLASGSDWGKVSLWETQSGTQRFTLPHAGQVWAVAFTQTGEALASAASDKVIKLWNAKSGELERILENHSDGVRSLAFTPDGGTLASSSQDHTIDLWDASSAQLRRKLQDDGRIWRVAFAPDGRTLASCSECPAIKLWDVEDGELLRTLEGHSDWVWDVAFTRDGRTLASCSADQTVKLWDAKSGQLRRTLDGHSDRVRCLAFSPDGTALASASDDTTIKIWDVESGRQCYTLRGHSDDINSVVYTSSGRILASGSSDGTIRLWDTKTSACVLTMLAMPEGGSLLVLPDGRFDADEKSLAHVRVSCGLSLYPAEAFPDLRAPNAVLAALACFRSSVSRQPGCNRKP